MGGDFSNVIDPGGWSSEGGLGGCGLELLT